MGSRPNVLCISIDSLRADFVSFLNSTEKTTPFLESFAERSTVYSCAISPATWTLPAHSSLFTGLYPPEHGMFHKDVVLGEHPTFAELLADEGYTTRAYARNGWLEVGDILRGFSAVSAVKESSKDNEVSLLSHVGDILELTPNEVKDAFVSLYNVYGGLITDTLQGLELIDQAETELPIMEEPFCSFVHLNDVHYTYTPSYPAHKKYRKTSTLQRLKNLCYWQPRIYNNREDTWRGQITLPESQIETLKGMYCGCIREADQLVEQLLTTLERRGKLQNTIVAIFGDHGDAFGEEGIFGHQFTLSDSVIRVPLLLFDPTGSISSGTVDHPVQLNDLYPTILELCGLDPPETNSVSLVSDQPRQFAFSHYKLSERQKVDDRANFDEIDESNIPPKEQFCVWRTPDDKLIWYPESNQYVGPSKDSSRLQSELEQHISSHQPLEYRNSTPDVSDGVLKNLQQMGYLE